MPRKALTIPKIGDPITAKWAAEITARVNKLRITGPDVVESIDSFHIRRPPLSNAGLKWVVVRPPIPQTGPKINVEFMIEADDYETSGAWLAESEVPGATGPFTLTEMYRWPNRGPEFYTEFAWDGATTSETQILMAFKTSNRWFVDPYPPWLVVAKPSTLIQTPCTEQVFTP